MSDAKYTFELAECTVVDGEVTVSFCRPPETAGEGICVAMAVAEALDWEMFKRRCRDARVFWFDGQVTRNDWRTKVVQPIRNRKVRGRYGE